MAVRLEHHAVTGIFLPLGPGSPCGIGNLAR